MRKKSSVSSQYQAEKKYLQKSWTICMALVWMLAMFGVSPNFTIIDHLYITAAVLFLYLLGMMFIRSLYDK